MQIAKLHFFIVTMVLVSCGRLHPPDNNKLQVTLLGTLAPASPTPLGISEETRKVISLGTATGKLYFPSEGIPRMAVYFENLDSGQVYELQKEGRSVLDPPQAAVKILLRPYIWRDALLNRYFLDSPCW